MVSPWKMDCAALVSLRNESRHCPIRGCVMPAQNALRIGCQHGATHFQAEVSRSLQTGRGAASRARSCRQVMPGGPCIEIGGTSPPLRECVGTALLPSCSGGRKAGVESGEVSLKLSSGASLPTLLPSSATPLGGVSSSGRPLVARCVHPRFAAGSGDPRRARRPHAWEVRTLSLWASWGRTRCQAAVSFDSFKRLRTRRGLPFSLRARSGECTVRRQGRNRRTSPAIP